MDFSSFLFLRSAKHAHSFTLILKKGCKIPRDRFLRFFFKMKERKTKPRKKLGSTRVDVSLETRLKYTRMIVIQKMKPKEVSKIFEDEHGKPMASTTYKRWRREGPDLLKDHLWKRVLEKSLNFQTQLAMMLFGLHGRELESKDLKIMR